MRLVQFYQDLLLQHKDLLQVHEDTKEKLARTNRELSSMTETYAALQENIRVNIAKRDILDAKQEELMAMIDAMSKKLEEVLER